MQRNRLLLTFFVCLVAIVMLVGCNTLDSVLKDGGNSAPLAQILNKVQENSTNKDKATAVITNSEKGESTVKLYFSDKKGKQLVEVNRTIPKTLSLARETVSQWLMGPAGGAADVYPAVNPQTTLRDINIKNGVATVDLSKQFLETYSNIAPETTLYGLVNTLAQFSTVQIVKIRVEGKGVDSFHGINLSDLRFRNDIIGSSTGPGVEQGQAAATSKGSPSSVNLFEN